MKIYVKTFINNLGKFNGEFTKRCLNILWIEYMYKNLILKILVIVKGLIFRRYAYLYLQELCYITNIRGYLNTFSTR